MSSYLVTDDHTQLSLSSSPDNFAIQDREDLTIKNIRRLVQWTYTKPFGRSYKLAFIQHAEHLNTESQNALLKTLEEPTPTTFIFLATQNDTNILETIKSRCTKISLDQLKGEELRHQPTDQSWTTNFIFGERITTELEIPTITDKKSALEVAERLATKTREELIYLLDEWLTKYNTTHSANLKHVKNITYALECIQNNCNVQLTLEVLLLSIAEEKEKI